MSDDTIRLSPHATFWVLFFALALIAFLIFSEILLPFVAGFILAYLFHPIAHRMQRVGVHRCAAAVTIIAGFHLLIVVVLGLIVPPMLKPLCQLIQDFPGY